MGREDSGDWLEDVALQVSDATDNGGPLPNDILQLVATYLPSPILAQARLVCKRWSSTFTPSSRTLYVQQSVQNTRQVLATLPDLRAVTLCSLAAAGAFVPHLSALASDGTAITQLTLEHRCCPRGPDLGPSVPLPPRLRSLDLISQGLSWSRALICGISALPHLTQLTIIPISRSDLLGGVPWRAFSRLQRLQLRLAPDEPLPDATPGARTAVRPAEAPPDDPDWAPALLLLLAAQLPELSHLRLSNLPNPADDLGVAKLLRLATAAAMAAAAGEPPAAALSRPATAAASAPEDGPSAPAAVSIGSAFTAGALQQLDLDFADADDECDFVRSAETTFGANRRSSWRRTAGSSSRDGGGGSQCYGSGSRAAVGRWEGQSTRLWNGGDGAGGVGDAASWGSRLVSGCPGGGVALGLRVMVVANDSDRDSYSARSGRSSSSSVRRSASRDGRDGGEGIIRRSSDGSRCGSSRLGCRSGSRSRIGSGVASSSEESSGEEGGPAEENAGGGGGGGRRCRRSHSSGPGAICRTGEADRAACPAANDVTDDLVIAIRDLLQSLVLPHLLMPSPNLRPTTCPPLSVPPGTPAPWRGTPDPWRTDPQRVVSNAAGGHSHRDDSRCSRSRSPSRLPSPQAPYPPPPSCTDKPKPAPPHCSRRPAAGPGSGASTPATSPALPQGDGGVSGATVVAAAPPAGGAVAVTGLDMVLCCDGAAGMLGAQALALDLSCLPGLRSLGLRLFSDTATHSFSQGCELRLRGCSQLSSLRLLRSDGAAPPPELGGGLVAALAREAPRLRVLVAEGAVLKAAAADATARSRRRGAAKVAAATVVNLDVAPQGDADGGAGLAALMHCRRLEHLELRLLPYCGPPRYSRTVSAAWLPPSLTRLELANAVVLAADAEAPQPHGPVGAGVAAPEPPAPRPRPTEPSSDVADIAGGDDVARRPSAGSPGVDPLHSMDPPPPVHPRLTRLAHLTLQGCHVDQLLSLSYSTGLTHLALSDCAPAPALTADDEAAAWPSLRTLAVSATRPAPLRSHALVAPVAPVAAIPPGSPASVSPLEGGHHQHHHHHHHHHLRLWVAPELRGGAAVGERWVVGAGSEADARGAWALRPADVEALAALSGLRSLSWQVPHVTAGIDPATLERLSRLSALRRLSVHLGYDNHVTPAQLVSYLGRMCGLVEAEVAVGYGPCRAYLAGEMDEGVPTVAAESSGAGGCGGGGGGGGVQRLTRGSVGQGSLGDWLAEALPNTVVNVRR